MTVALLGGSFPWCCTDAPETWSWFVSLWQLRHVMWDRIALVCGRMTGPTVSAWSHTQGDTGHWPDYCHTGPGDTLQGEWPGGCKGTLPGQEEEQWGRTIWSNDQKQIILVKDYSKSKRFYERLKLKSYLLLLEFRKTTKIQTWLSS